jgi:hypothetical protein
VFAQGFLVHTRTHELLWFGQAVESAHFEDSGVTGRVAEKLAEQGPSAVFKTIRAQKYQYKKASDTQEVRREEEHQAAAEREEPKKDIVLATGTSPTVSVINEIRKDSRFIAYDNETVFDTKTKLMWASQDSGSDISWVNAKSYCENYRGGGYTDWRMPTHDELAGLYDSNKKYKATKRNYDVHLTELIQLSTCCPWSSWTPGSGAAYFAFYPVWPLWDPLSGLGDLCALPVRSTK